MAINNKSFYVKTISNSPGNVHGYDGVINNQIVNDVKVAGFFNPVAASLIQGDIISCSCVDGNNVFVVATTPILDSRGNIIGDVSLEDYSAGAVAYQKVQCKCATTANITLSGLQTIDAYTTLANDRVLVKDQTNAAQNGIYNASSGAWNRALDMDTWNEFIYSSVYVENGTVNANTGWVFSNPSGGTVGVTNVSVVKTSGAGITSQIGDYKDSAINSNHAGWVLCNGVAISRTTYNSLFTVIGTSFGAGDGSTTFNIPDARGRTFGYIGQGSGLTNRTIGQLIGTETHTLSVEEMPSHNHSISDPSHSHLMSPAGHWYFSGSPGRIQNFYTGGYWPAEAFGSIALATTGITIQNNGSGSSHNNMSPYLFGGNLFIYAGV